MRAARNCTNNYATATGALTSSYADAITTPILGLVVKPWQNVAFFANRSEALAAGQQAPQTALNYGTKLAPARTKQYEVGVKYDVKNGVITLTGEVNSSTRRAEAQKVAASVPNVQQVVNKLDLKNQKATSSN